jgi:hypothetical protein
MAHKLTRLAFRQLINEDIAWLEQQPRTLERDHILMALKESERFHYDLPDLLQRIVAEDDALTTAGKEGLSDVLADEVFGWVDQLEGPHGD